MNKRQKMGFLTSACTFLFIGIIFLIVGYIYNENVLRFMGALWTPLATINLIFLFIMFKKC